MFFQNIINIAVAGFIFLAGYFVNIEKVQIDIKKYILSKSSRILIPYFLWSLFYIVLNIVVNHHVYSLKSLMMILLLGKASVPLYYCVLYFLFIIITPFVIKRMNNRFWNLVFYAVMPLWYIIIYYFQIKHNYSYSHWGILPFSWFFYFYLGLKMQHRHVKMSWFLTITLVIAGFILEMIEMSVLYSVTQNNYFSVTPLRYSTILYMYGFILIFLKLDKLDNDFYKFTFKPLISLGNNSFGIYLSHMAILPYAVYFITKIMNIDALDYMYITYILIVLFITLFICDSAINLFNQFIPNKYLRWIGFA